MKLAKHDLKIEAYPFLREENSQIVGYCNECKYSFQCGHLKCLCTHPDTEFKYCFFGWYTGGLIPDKLCDNFNVNPDWMGVSVNHFVNRKYTLNKISTNPDNNITLSNDVMTLDNIGEYLHKPVTIFVVGVDDSVTVDDIANKFTYLRVGISKTIIRIKSTEEYDKLETEIKQICSQLPGLGYIPNLVLTWDGNKELADKVIQVIKDIEDVQVVNIATRLVHSKTIQRNEVVNLSNINNDIWAYAMKGIFKGKTIICIAGGPSLNEDIERIKANQDKFVIFAVTTVVEVLLKNGITPHIIGNIDMKDHNMIYLNSLSDDQMKKMHLLYEIDSNYSVVDTYTGDKILLIADLRATPITSLLTNYYDHSKYQNINKSGTVANMMYQFAKYTEPDQIILAGYDLCYPTDESHVKGARLQTGIETVQGEGGTFVRHTKISEEVKQRVGDHAVGEDGKLKSVDQGFTMVTNDGNTAISTKTFYTYWLELNIRIQAEPRIRTIDIGKIGAKKTGAEFIELCDIIDDIPNHNDDITELINTSTRKIVNSKSLKNIYKNIIKGRGSEVVKENHVAKLTFIVRQYTHFKDILHDNIIVKLISKISKTAEEDLQPFIDIALNRIKERTKND